MSQGHYPGSLPEPAPGLPRATLRLRAVPDEAAWPPQEQPQEPPPHGQPPQEGYPHPSPQPHLPPYPARPGPPPSHAFRQPPPPGASGRFAPPGFPSAPPGAPVPVPAPPPDAGRAPAVGHTGVGHTGVGHTGVGHTGVGHTGVGHTGVSHAGQVGRVGQGPFAVLLIGAAGAGKTSVARHWAEHRSAPTAHISLDDVREWVRAGFANPQSGWNDQSEAQYRLARRTCGFAARNYLANGISCIIDDAVFPDRPAIGLGGWKRHVGPGLLSVVLLPGLDVVLARNAQRSGVRRLADEEVARIHGRMAGWYGSGLPIIDNSRLDVPGTSAALDRVLDQALAQPRPW